MKRFTAILILIAIVAAGYAQNIQYTLLSSNQSEAVVRVDFGTYQTETVSVNGIEMQKLHMAGAYPILKAGSPELLQTAFSLIIPEGSSPEAEILDAQFTTVEHFALAPSKGKLYRNVNLETVAYTINQDYQADRYLLGNSVVSGDQYQLRDYHGMNFKVYPFDYNPAAQTLKIYSSVTVKVTFNGMRSASVPTKNNRTFDAVYANQFLNYKSLRGTPVVEEGAILIIAPEEFMAAMQPYADWKIRNGYPTEMVSVMATGNNANAIKSYILDYYNEHNLAFVIIVGDNAQFPTPTIGGNKVDNYFTQLVGSDSYPDIILGKISAENVNQVSTQVQRFIEYEQNPPQTEHFSSFMGIASDQGPGDNNEYDYQHIRNIDNKLQGYTYTAGYELFEGSQGGLDASGNPTASMVTTAVNSGVGIISYCGHGAEQQWVTTGFDNNNVNALTNVGKLPFILSVACVNGEYHTGTCFAEAWLRATHNGEPTGAVGFLGSTINQPWNSPMCAQDAMIDLLIGNTTLGKKITYGGMFFNALIHMLDVYNDVEVFRTWILFGDPTLLMRTAVPEQLLLSHNEILPAGIPSVTFSSAVENAKITIIKNGEILNVGYIENGDYIFTFSETYLPIDTLHVLATAPNYIPYEGTISFIPNDGPYIIVNGLSLSDQIIPYVNNRPNGLAEFGKTMLAAPQIVNIGNQTAQNIRIKVSTTDEYITMNDFSQTISALAGHDTLSNPPTFTFKVSDTVPANHIAVFNFEVIFNNDTIRQSKTVKLYAPTLKIISMGVDDSELGNGNQRIDYGETFNLTISISNTGNMPITSGYLFLENPGNEIIVTTDPIPFTAIGVGETLVVPVEATVSDAIQESTITFIKSSLWVNYYYARTKFSLKIGAVIEDWESGEFTNMEWQNTSSIPWTITTQSPYEGSYCAKSGAISDNANTTLKISYEVQNADSLAFYYKVSSEENYDKLMFKIDGHTKDEWSGSINWTRAVYPISAGTHTFTWTYSKDAYSSYGRDCAYIDAISFPCGKINHPVGVIETVQGGDLFQVWPNPTTDVIRIQWDNDMENMNRPYSLFDLSGKLLQGGRLSDNQSEIDMRHFAPGTYILKVEDSNLQTHTAKIIKK